MFHKLFARKGKPWWIIKNKLSLWYPSLGKRWKTSYIHVILTFRMDKDKVYNKICMYSGMILLWYLVCIWSHGSRKLQKKETDWWILWIQKGSLVLPKKQWEYIWNAWLESKLYFDPSPKLGKLERKSFQIRSHWKDDFSNTNEFWHFRSSLTFDIKWEQVCCDMNQLYEIA